MVPLRGLLYTDPLIPPSTNDQKYGPLTPPCLHVRQIVDSSSSGAPSCLASCFCQPSLSSAFRVLDTNPFAPPAASTSSPASSTDSLAEKVLYFQRLGFQLDVSLEDLHLHADGVPVWPISTPPICGHCSPSSASTVADALSSSSPDTTPSLAALLLAPVADSAYIIHHLTRDQLRILWHQRLGHLHSRRVSDLHRYAQGVPPVPIATELDSCPICIQAKLRKAARGVESSRHALLCNQGISVDFGFIVQRSADSARVRRLQGLHGETCYCLIADHYSGTLYGETFRSKAPPIDFLNRWLAQHGLPVDVPDKYVRFDLGGDLGRCSDVVTLFQQAGYAIEPTAPNSSHQNGPGERPHQTIGDAIRAMLGGAALPPKFWPYAFHHYLRLYNVTVHRDHSASPFELCTGQKPNLRFLRVFGCRVYALPARSRRADKIVSDARVGIFLGFAKTMKNILYYDSVTETVKTAQHVAFDEVMHDLDDKPPNARLLDGIRNARPDVLDFTMPVPDLEVSPRPFTTFSTVTVSIDPAADSPLGLGFDTCSRLKRVFVSAVHRPAAGSNLRAFRRQHLGSYVVSINDVPVFSVSDLESLVTSLLAQPSIPATVDLVLAPERRSDFDDRPSPLHLRMHDLRRICALQSISGEGMTFADYRSSLDTAASDLTEVAMSNVIHRLQTEGMTPEERRLSKFTRRNLQQLPNWSSWDAAFDTQLDAHCQAGTIGRPVPRPPTTDGYPPNVLRIQWNNVVKPDGTRKCRACLDGSKRSAPWLRQFTQTYASCIEQPCMRLFFAVAAAKSLIVTVADTTNAFQQSPPPTKKCYLMIDDAYQSWHRKRYGSDVNPKTHVIPLDKALQGHPEAGALWERMIVGILEGDELGFISTTQERNLYRGTINGELVLICRQVDDFAIASASTATADKLIAVINAHATTSSKGIGIPDDQGLGLRYNGIDVHQTRDHIKISCETYINRVLQTHGWEKPGARETDRFDSVPMTTDSATALVSIEGPLENTQAHRDLETEAGFGYRQVLGELVYAYVVCRLDIAFAITLLSRFASAPAHEHYAALKTVAKYLRKTRDWGIVYWRDTPIESLPAISIDRPTSDASLPAFPSSKLLQLVGFVDAAHATDVLTRRSITGLVFCLAGGAIAYKSKLQATVATSSTEAEFIAAVQAAKTAKYLRSVLHELGIPQTDPTPLYEDNMAAIAMINERKPTPRSRHIDIQHFAIQEWRQRGLIIMHHIPGVINVADQATKALSWTLHSRHARRSMGHYGPS